MECLLQDSERTKERAQLCWETVPRHPADLAQLAEYCMDVLEIAVAVLNFGRDNKQLSGPSISTVLCRCAELLFCAERLSG
jgi:hypothetical protein